MAKGEAEGSYAKIENQPYTSWTKEYKSTFVREKNRWIMDITIPFASLGKKPAPGDIWQIGVNRNNVNYHSGFPAGINSGISMALTKMQFK